MLEEKPNSGLEGYIEGCENEIKTLKEDIDIYAGWLKLVLSRLKAHGYPEVRFKITDPERTDFNKPRKLINVVLDAEDTLILRLVEDFDAD